MKFVGSFKSRNVYEILIVEKYVFQSKIENVLSWAEWYEGSTRLELYAQIGGCIAAQGPQKEQTQA